ncbi:MAG: hypothetical protein JF612_03505 [Planctomycetia bacterium]|jgi:hypothetical protein|nr:hypothetical protein [Planctomycetia bacterium]
MNEYDPFEKELAALKPLSPSLGLNDQIAHQLENGPQPLVTPTKYAARRAWQLTLALSVAVVMLAMIFIRRGEQQPIVPQAPRSPLDLATALDPSLPTVWTYHRAISGSSQEIDALLDKHSHTTPTPASEFHVGAFSMSKSELQSF